MIESLRIFSAIATAIALEALPFLAIGSLLSALVEVFVTPERLTRLAPRGALRGAALGVAVGVVVPTCECGVVPVARRLLRKGAPAPFTLAYMLAAPIVNPVVLISTYVAFRGSWRMVGARALIAVVVAVTVAWIVRHAGGRDVLREGAAGRGHDAHGCGAAASSRSWRGAGLRVLQHAASDFLEMGKYLIVGALAAAAFKAFLPPGSLAPLEGNLLVAVAGMMFLAVVLSVCSEADAFVAASFLSLPAAAHLAFITIGPMVDLKLLALYGATFRKRVVLVLVIVPVVLVFALTLLAGVML